MIDTSSDSPIPPGDWNARYAGNDTPWDLGQANPSLIQALERAHGLGLPRPSDMKGSMAALLPGCGRGHDGLPLLKAGYKVVGVDFASEAVEAARARWSRYGGRAEVKVADVTALPEAFTDAFDIVLEHTCFVAIRPCQRQGYLENVSRALKPRGWLIGVLFTAERDGGPPYTFSPEGIRQVLGSRFDILHLAEAEGGLKRREMMGEWGVIARLKA